MAAKTKIVIVEDDVAIVQMYRMKFEDQGYQVATAVDGQSGLALVKQDPPDILLLDLMMPVMDGTAVLRQLRQLPEGKNLKVIVLTNVGESEAPAEIRQLGVKDFIVKAEMTPRQVAERVKQVLAS